MNFDRNRAGVACEAIPEELSYQMIRRFEAPLSEDLMDYVAVDVGQAEVAARVSIRKLRMAETHEVQNGRVQIVRVDWIFNGCRSVFVGPPGDRTTKRFNANFQPSKPKSNATIRHSGRRGSEFESRRSD